MVTTYRLYGGAPVVLYLLQVCAANANPTSERARVAVVLDRQDYVARVAPALGPHVSAESMARVRAVLTAETQTSF